MAHSLTSGRLPAASTSIDKISERPPRSRGSVRTWMVACFTLATWCVGAGVGRSDVGTLAPLRATQPAAPAAARLAALEARLAKQDAAIGTLQHGLAKAQGWQARLAQQDATIRTLQRGLARAQATVSTLQGRMASIAAVSDLAPFVQVVPGELNGLKGPHVIFSGCNVHIRSGSGFTNDRSANPNDTGGPFTGLGNLVVGYNETNGPVPAGGRGGSHNLIIGPGHLYTSVGGLVAGFENTISGPFSSVSGGQANTASGAFSSVSGGASNRATGMFSSVSGGGAPGPNGGNTASGPYSSISGGQGNTASGPSSSVSGGGFNTVRGNNSSVSGGSANTVSGNDSSVSGGQRNTASGPFSSVSGGSGNQAIGGDSSVSGGQRNTASGLFSSVSGGHTVPADGRLGSSGRSPGAGGGRAGPQRLRAVASRCRGQGDGAVGSRIPGGRSEGGGANGKQKREPLGIVAIAVSARVANRFPAAQSPSWGARFVPNS